MKITMLTIGSTGDVRPYVLLGRELKSRGHEITIATFSGFEKMIGDAGLNYCQLSGDAVKVMSNVMKPGVNGVGFLGELEKSLRDVAPVLLNDLYHACDGADAMMCTYFGSLYYSIAEKHKIPCIQTHYFPMDPNDLTPISSAPGQHLGKVWNRTSYKLGYLLIGILEKRYLTKWRRDNGMEVRKPQTRPDYRVNGHTVPVIYAVSPMVLPRAKNWGEHIHMSGFWWDDTPVNYTPPKELEEFLAAGEKPIYIGFGSMVSGNMSKTYAKVLKAVRAARVRAVISLGWAAEQMHFKSNSRVYFADYVPHDWLFPRVSAVVHHGGAGTTAAGLRYGKPTLVIPFGGDQPFWGARVNAIGCGPRPIHRDTMTVQRLTRALIDLTGRGSYRVAAEELSQRLRLEKGVQTAADLVEKEIAQWRQEDAQA